MKFEDLKAEQIVELMNKALEKEYLNQPHFFVPLDYSPLAQEGVFSIDDVVYSTACRISHAYHTKTGTKKEERWTTHMILTKSIIGFLAPGAQEGKWIGTYPPWIDAEDLEFYPDYFKYKKYKFEPVRIDEFESKDMFKNRLKDFGKLTALLWTIDHLEREAHRMLVDKNFKTKIKKIVSIFYDKKLEFIKG